MKIDTEETKIGAHAILLDKAGKAILQERDNFPGLINAGLISMFGGTIRSGETLVEGLKRELIEELDLDTSNLTIEKLGTYQKTNEIDGIDWIVNVFVVRDIDISGLRVHEGKAFYKAWPKDALKNKRLTRITRIALKDLVKNLGKDQSRP